MREEVRQFKISHSRSRSHDLGPLYVIANSVQERCGTPRARDCFLATVSGAAWVASETTSPSRNHNEPPQPLQHLTHHQTSLFHTHISSRWPAQHKEELPQRKPSAVTHRTGNRPPRPQSPRLSLRKTTSLRTSLLRVCIAENRSCKNKTVLTKKLDWGEEETQTHGDKTHLWEESWDDDDTNEDFAVQLR